MMIKRASGIATTKITFAIPTADCDQPVSVVGDFNGWDPHAHPLKKRSNGTRSVSAELAPGHRYRFRYLAADGSWFGDPDAETVGNDYGGVDSLVTT